MTEMNKEKVLQILEAARDAIVSEYGYLINNATYTAAGWYKQVSEEHHETLAEFDAMVTHVTEKLS